MYQKDHWGGVVTWARARHTTDHGDLGFDTLATVLYNPERACRSRDIRNPDKRAGVGGHTVSEENTNV